MKFTAFIAVVALLILTACERSTPQREGDDLSVNRLLGGEADAGFARADSLRPFVFPDDHGPHPRFRSEWWYFTGNLATETGRRFGYQWTLFRFALEPQSPQRPSQWATNQIYMGHLTLTDVEAGTFHAFERLERGSLGLAGARSEPLALWVEAWQLREQDDGRLRLQAQGSNDTVLDLTLQPAKPVVLQGERGLSRKSAEPGNASYYYSIPRLRTEGTVQANGERFEVQGLSWMDREWSTSALGPEQSGWDWFALQLSDGHDLIFYRLRRNDGSTDPHSAGTFIGPDGGAKRLAAADVRLQVLDHWRSDDGVTYPSRWRLRIPAADLDLEVVPVLADQELDLSVRYWEGAVDVRGRHGDLKITGRGYAELAGYGSEP